MGQTGRLTEERTIRPRSWRLARFLVHKRVADELSQLPNDLGDIVEGFHSHRSFW